MAARTLEDDYADRVAELDERLSSTSDGDERLRRIAREEADKRMVGLIYFALFLGAAYRWGWVGAAGFGLFFIAKLFVEIALEERRKGAEPDKVVRLAENLVRLQITAEAYRAGEKCWYVQDKRWDTDEARICATANRHWDNFWQRVHDVATEFQGLSPRQRKQRLQVATKNARAALEQMSDLAKLRDASPVFWASDALFRLRN